MKQAALLLAAALSLAGCATMFSGTTDRLTFRSNVPGVRLTLDGQYLGELPLSLEQSRNFMGGKPFSARFEAPGYRTQEFTLQRQFNAVAILDISSPITSGGIDVLSGAIMKFSPLDYHVEMLPDAATSADRRALELRTFTFANFRGLQADLARGGGERLDALATLACNGNDAEARAFSRTAAANAPALVRAADPYAFWAGLEPLRPSR